jgi:hypothetical protein
MDISGAYDNVLIYVLCGVMLEKEQPLGIVRFIWSLLWCKTLIFCVGCGECMTLTGYKSLPQGSVLSPFLYNLLGSGMDIFVVPSVCDILTFFNMLMILWCTRHTMYFRLLVPWFRRPARHSVFFFCAVLTQDILYKV